ncbi:histidinol-phosphate transaminase [Rubellicoccus peritrichatus]|uniref:Histidinol-phosphate aminotransferase n=1 Tax=Rubellicoccus peritrichatus TaxID=3080537 RepID=A0AAQ3QY68_9BACT|nr:histidinol-phosphate transaminase [Puniceicoccus sp. CR14]WOO43515.1 histidinol-phosphate transaminase [Puniceicoccus sp. CR14]
MDINKLANPHVAAMSAYVPGMQPTEPGWVKLNTNELPYAPSPKVIEVIQAELANDAVSLRLYPNPNSAPLREAVAKHHHLNFDQVLIGNGADDVLNLLCRTFASAEKSIGMTVPSYSLYQVLAAAQGAQMENIEFDRSMELPQNAIKSCPANLFFLTNPNAPTGKSFSNDEIRKAANGFSGIFVVDETYAPFAEENAVGLLSEIPNLVIVRSFSKAFGLAGLRVGYALSSPGIIDLLDRVRDSYNVDRLAQAAALAAISHSYYYEDIANHVRDLRDRMEAWYRELGWFVYKSSANFHFVEPLNFNGESGLEVSKSLFEHLHEQKILVRSFPKHALTKSFLRISLGSESEMETLKGAIKSWQKTL